MSPPFVAQGGKIYLGSIVLAILLFSIWLCDIWLLDRLNEAHLDGGQRRFDWLEGRGDWAVGLLDRSRIKASQTLQWTFSDTVDSKSEFKNIQQEGSLRRGRDQWRVPLAVGSL